MYFNFCPTGKQGQKNGTQMEQASYGEASSDHNNKGWIPGKVNRWALTFPVKCEVRQHSIMGGHSQWCVTKCRLLRTLTPLPPLSWPLLLPSAFSSVFINFKASRRYICRLTLDPCPGRRWRFSAGGLVCLITHSPYTRSATSRPFWWRQKPDNHFKFHKPRTHDLERKKRKITDEARRPHACLLSLSHSHFLSCHSLPADFCEPSLSW